ncbi:hypothetical protein TW85_23885 [Marinomonas sp. S3726]|nr:hypothetical protein TW85_23885 [Marinomonas sp. S3726]
MGYFKASNADSFDSFGDSIALSADGKTLAVGAAHEDSLATGIASNQADNSAETAGAVYIFSLSNNIWTQQAYIKASNTDYSDYFGSSLALSFDGNTLAVGSYAEDSNATGVNGDQANNSFQNSGAVYVYTRDNSFNWAQQAYIKASNTGRTDFFSKSISLSADGNTLAVSAQNEGSNATGINGDQFNNNEFYSGAVYVYIRDNTETWSQQAYIKASNTKYSSYFGNSVSLSLDGNTLAVGSLEESSNATGINGDQNNYDASESGAVYVFTRSNSVWSQQAYLKANNTDAFDYFGYQVALSKNGNTLAVSAHREDSNSVGINGDHSNNDAVDSGAVYIFTRNNTSWIQEAYIKASNTGSVDLFGISLALSSNGNTLAVGALNEDSNSIGINGGQADSNESDTGAVYTFTRVGSNWTQQAYIHSSRPRSFSKFSTSLALSADGKTLAVGATSENGKGTGVNSNPTEYNLYSSGAVYLY